MFRQGRDLIHLLLIGRQIPRLDGVVAAARVDGGPVGVPGGAQHRLIVRLHGFGHAGAVRLDLPTPHLRRAMTSGK
jgi:hypothetical protein